MVQPIQFLHLLAAAQEAEVNFTMKDIDELSKKIPNLCKVAPSVSHYHMEDVHRAGGVQAILKELQKGKLINDNVKTVYSQSLKSTLEKMGY